MSRTGQSLSAAVMLLVVVFAGTLATAAEPGWVIENRSPGSAPAKFAAEELHRYLGETTGVPPRFGQPEPGEARIVIGLRDALSQQEAAHLPPAASGFDGYSVAITTAESGEPLWIIGGDNDRGLLYGAYDVLERLGWRWFHPQLDPEDAEVRPRTTSISLPDGAWAVASPMRIRALIWYVGRRRTRRDPPKPDELRAQIDWAVKSRYNTLEYRAIEFDRGHPLRKMLTEEAARRGLQLQSPGHNFDLFFPNSAEAFAAHPEWFGEQEGRRRRHGSAGSQFCWTHEGAMETFVENAAKFVASRPELDTLTLSALDGGNVKPCKCERCAAESATDRYLELVNRVAAKLAKTAPHVTVEAVVAYQHVDALPKTVQPHERLRGRFAVWRRDVSAGYDTDRFGAGLQAWSNSFQGRLTAFQYYSDHLAGPALAMPYTKQIRGDREFLQKAGAGGFLNLLYPQGYWWRQTLNAYLAGRAFYDASSDPTDLLADYARQYHGPEAGPLMETYYRALADRPELGYGVYGVGRLGQRRLLERLRETRLEPAADAVRDDPVLSHRMAKAKTWHHLAEQTLAVGLEFRRARKAAAAGRREEAERLLRQRAPKRLAKLLELANEVSLLNQGIVDRSFAGLYQNRFEQSRSKAERFIASLPAEGSPSGPARKARSDPGGSSR